MNSTPTEHNSEADNKNKLLLQRIQSEVVRIIRNLEEKIKLETEKTNVIMENINKMKKQFESKCWIIPRVPLDVHHPDYYEEVKLNDIDFTKTYYVKYQVLNSQYVKFIPGTLKNQLKKNIIRL